MLKWVESELKMRIHKHFAESDQRNICKIFEIISVYLGLCICQIIVRECSLISAIIIVLSQDTFKGKYDICLYGCICVVQAPILN